MAVDLGQFDQSGILFRCQQLDSCIGDEIAKAVAEEVSWLNCMLLLCLGSRFPF